MQEDICVVTINTKSHRDEFGRWHWNFESDSCEVEIYPEWCCEGAEGSAKVYGAHGVRPWEWIGRKAGEILPELESVLDRDYNGSPYVPEPLSTEDRFIPAVYWACRRNPDAAIMVFGQSQCSRPQNG